jgi:hypothetical protein
LVAGVEALFAAEVEHIAEGVDECGLGALVADEEPVKLFV